MSTPEFPALLQAFFTNRLMQQRRASPHTIAAYRHTFRLLLRFAATRLGRAPCALALADLDAPFRERVPRRRRRDRAPRDDRIVLLDDPVVCCGPYRSGAEDSPCAFIDTVIPTIGQP